MKCEERRWKDGQPCQHEAKYLVKWNDMVVCGVHNRGYIRGIPLAELEPVGGDR